MIETMIVAALLVGLAKRGRRRRRRGVRMLKVSELISLGALGAGAMISGVFDSTVDDTTYLLSIEAVWSLAEHTVGQGPIVVGVAHSDYTSSEIGAWFAAAGAWDRGNLVAGEVNTRKIRQAGVFNGNEVSETLNDGRAIKTKLGFSVSPGDTLQTWALNQDTSPLTTGSLVLTDGKVWAAR